MRPEYNDYKKSADFISEKITLPTVPITNAGEAQFERYARRQHSFSPIIPSPYSEHASRPPMGKPQNKPMSSTVAPCLDSPKNFSNGLPKSEPIKFISPWEIIISEISINGNRDGIIDIAHILNPSRMAITVVSMFMISSAARIKSTIVNSREIIRLFLSSFIILPFKSY